MSVAPAYSITELAAEFGVTPRTIRHYEDEGLLHPRRDGTNRVFSHRDRARLKLALLAKRTGFSLGEVRELFDLHDLAQRTPGELDAFVGKLDAHRQDLERQRADIQVMLDEIDFFTTQYRRKRVNSRHGTPDSEPPAAAPHSRY